MLIPRFPARAVLACALMTAAGAAGAASADMLEAHKLRILSCDTKAADKAAQRSAGEWLHGYTKSGKDGKTIIAGPLELGKACLKNVTIEAGPGAYMVKGEICNARLDDFTGALADIGTTLDKDGEKLFPSVVMSLKKYGSKKDSRKRDEREYAITKGMWDFQTGRPVPMSNEYGFMCGASAGGPQ